MADLAGLQEQRARLKAKIQALGGKQKNPELVAQLGELDKQIKTARGGAATEGEAATGGNTAPGVGETGVSSNTLVGKQGGKTKGTEIGGMQSVNPALMGPASQVEDIAIEKGLQAQFRDRQMALADALQGLATGRAPSVAEALFRNTAQQNVAAANSMAASSQYANPALARRLAAYGAGDAIQRAAQDASIAKMQEMQAAQQALGNVLASGREGDIGLATEQAGINKDVAALNQQAINERMAQQASLEQTAAQFNAGQVNQATVDQARINAAIRQAQISGGATMGAANAAAGASRYGTDASVLINANQLAERRRENDLAAGVGVV